MDTVSRIHHLCESVSLAQAVCDSETAIFAKLNIFCGIFDYYNHQTIGSESILIWFTVITTFITE